MTTVSIKLLRPYKSLDVFEWSKIPNFSVVTGVNGSGKSHLLQLIAESLGYAIDNRADQRDSKPGKVDGLPLSYGNILYTQAIKSIQFKVTSNLRDIEDRIDMLYERPSKETNGAWKASGKLYHDFSFKKDAYNQQFLQCPSKDDFRARLTPSIINNISLAGKNPDLALLFLSYSVLQADARQRNITESEIINNFGEAPWKLLNQIFEVADLPFRAEEPEEIKPSIFTRNVEYELQLFDTVKKVKISPNDLSDGEKVIVSMVFLHYTSEYGSSKYKLLLLDEPDTHLHPSFIKKYIKILFDVMVTEKQTRVIMTTHSPITVALVPEDSIYYLDRTKGCSPVKVSREVGLKHLLQGLPSLTVRHEKRRAIFVESKFDVTYYKGLYSCLSQNYDFNFDPIFLCPHTGTTNCTDVVEIVAKLESAGSDPVYGIIDFDNVNKPSNLIKILGCGKRYAIENYLLDPVIVALALVKYNKKKFSDFGVHTISSYIHATKLNALDVQLLVTSILNKVGLLGDSKTLVKLENGYSIEYPNDFLMCQGHKYESMLVNAYPELNYIKRGKEDDSLKKEMISVIFEFTDLLPIEIRETFESILSE